MFKVPQKTSTFKNEPINERYIIQFAPELVKFIKEKKKCVTYRYGLYYDYLKIGDVVKIRDTSTKEVVGLAKIIDKKLTTFVKLPLKTNVHESYEDKEHQRKVFSGYYAYTGREIQDNDPFIVLRFKLIRK